jgi:PKD repeat protein
VINITSKYAIYILPLLFVLIFADTALALPTITHGTVQGEMYVSSTTTWPSSASTNNFNVPDGTVVFAQYYAGVWKGQGSANSLSTTFNGHAFPTNPSYYTTEMGVTWIPYNVTDYVHPGETNTATTTSVSWGDGRQYGSTLVVVLKNESKPQIEYWIADGLDWMHYDGYLGYDASNSTTYFNGTVNLADVQNASLYSTHLTGFNYEDLNGNALPNAAESVNGEYFNYIRWDNVQSLLVPENQTILVSRGEDSYCSVGLHVLSLTYKTPDMVPVNLTPSFVTAYSSNTMTATIRNQGGKDSTAFNVSLLVNDTVVDSQTVSSLPSGSNTTVHLHWMPDGTIDAYSLTVIVDPDNEVVESDETNNILTSLVGTTSAAAPVANFIATPTSGDAPLIVNFTDTSTNSPTAWAWDFNNDGTIDSRERNPIYIYSTPGTYTVNLTVTNSGGFNSSAKMDYITASAVTPVANFIATTTSGAPPLTVTFLDKSANLPTSWAWDFENDGTVDSVEQNPVHTYSITGNYTVNFTAANAAGSNSTVRTNYITVVTPPVADFMAIPTSGDAPLTVTFTDNSTNNPTAWLWNFGDGTSSTSQNPVHTYSPVGNYTVSLKAINAGGSNTNVKTSYINALLAAGPVWTDKPEWKGPYIGKSPYSTTNAAPGLADLDDDGDHDLLVGTAKGISYGLENTGNKSSPVWTRKSTWDVPDVGSNAVPCLDDLDGDGDHDLLVGERSTGTTYGYENTGTKNSPLWTKKTSWNVLNVGTYAAPCLADLDGDGDYDLLIGREDGYTYGYENTGTKNSPVWTRKTSWDVPDMGSNSVPYLADLDGEGDYDLLIGASEGMCFGFENTGSKSNPLWARKNAWDVSATGSNPYSAAPCLADLNGDGDYDLLMGKRYEVIAFENTAPLPSKPDLTPDAITPPSNITVNTPCIISSTINNTGTGNASASNVTLSVNGTVVDTQAVSSIASGSSAVVNFTWTPVAAGDYNLTVASDPENEISESDETNNALTITVTVSTAPPAPDITNPVIDSTVLFPANTTAGSMINISVNATDNKEVTGVTAGDIQLTETDGLWQGNITAHSSVGNYSLLINASDAAGNTAEISMPYNVVQLSGSSSISVSPKISSVTVGSNVSPTLIVKNAQSIDDTFKVWISVSELPASSQANLTWFDWTEQEIKLRAGEEVSIPVKVDIPAGTTAGRKLFRVNVKSETTGISGFNTGYLTIT